MQQAERVWSSDLENLEPYGISHGKDLSQGTHPVLRAVFTYDSRHWWAYRRLQGRTGVTRSPITYPYRPSTPFLLLASAPHTVDLPSAPSFRLPHPRPRSTARRDDDRPKLPAQAHTCLVVVSMGVRWIGEVTGYPHLWVGGSRHDQIDSRARPASPWYRRGGAAASGRRRAY